MARKRQHQEHSNHEAWAIPYGDLVTLLLAFFVVMYAISSVNEGKYRVLSDSLSTAFTGSPRAADPIQVGLHTAGGRNAIDTGALSRTTLPGGDASALARIPLPSAAAAAAPLPASPEQQLVLERLAAVEAAKREQLDQIASDVQTAMAELIAAGQLVVRRADDWIEIEIRADALFSSGSATLGQAAIDAIERIADALRDGSAEIRVEGHTDNVPIRTAAFPSNWELSSARAAGVVRILADRGLDPARLSVLGLGDTRPRESNDTPAGRLANRRVLLFVKPALPGSESTSAAPMRAVAAAVN